MFHASELSDQFECLSCDLLNKDIGIIFLIVVYKSKLYRFVCCMLFVFPQSRF